MRPGILFQNNFSRNGTWSADNDIEYARDGVTAVRGVLHETEALTLLKEIKCTLPHSGPLTREHEPIGSDGRFHVNILMHLKSKLLHDLAFHPAITAIAKAAINQSRAYFFYDQLFYKAPLTTARTQWHQDLLFWPLKGNEVPSLWIALTECDEQRSSVQYVLGSHLWGRFFCPVNPSERCATSSNIDVCPDYHEAPFKDRVEIRSHALRPGDVVVHHPLVIHGAGPNLDTSSERAAVSLRYCGSEVEWDDRPNTMYFPNAHSELQSGVKMRDQCVFREV